jgi:ABC-type multidrug transport system ATPase subunit
VGVMTQGRLVAEGPPSSLRGAADRMRLDVDDVPRARAVVAATRGVRLAEDATADGLEVVFDDGVDPADLTVAFVRAGVRVRALVPLRDTLEDVFLHLVEGADVPR